MFSLTFSEEKPEKVDYRQKYNEEQQYSKFLEERVATYERVLGKYEKLEEKLNDKLIESANQNYNVDQFYTSAWEKLEKSYEKKTEFYDKRIEGIGDQINNFLVFLSIIFTIITIGIPLMYKFFILDKIEKKLTNQQNMIDNQGKSLKIFKDSLIKQDKELVDSKKSFEKYMEDQKESLKKQSKELEEAKNVIFEQQETIEKDLQEHEEFNKKINENLGETYRLFALNIFQSSIINEKYAKFESNGEFGFEYIFKAIKYYSEINNQKGIDDSAHVIYCVLYENEERLKREEKSYRSDLVEMFREISKMYPNELILIEKYVESLDPLNFKAKKSTLLEFLKETK